MKKGKDSHLSLIKYYYIDREHPSMVCSNKSVLSFFYLLRSRRGVGDKPMSCKPGVAGSIPGFSQSVG